MDLGLLLDNLTNPALLFFMLGLLAVYLKSDLEIPGTSSKFISLYLLFAIGFKGGQELSHSALDAQVLGVMALGLVFAGAVPVYTFLLLRRRMSVENAGAIAAAYGSVSAVTFVTAAAFLEIQHQHFGGHMVAVMALMEAPAIVVGMLLIRTFSSERRLQAGSRQVLSHAFTNSSVLLILGSLAIGYLASEEQAQGIKPFTTDIFKGFLAIFLLDMGISSGRKLKGFLEHGWFNTGFAMVAALVNGCLAAWISGAVTDSIGDRFMLSILATGASYIAVPAAMKIAVPKADPGLYIPMALAITFPFNITLGFPLYYLLATHT
ncbi:MAG: sodium-dependent bicarbonate transport family permease [Flavobacteriales bacterium]|nr:sodium-dependent bicarbonate transport family permease [Flavobacteriales bacterium]